MYKKKIINYIKKKINNNVHTKYKTFGKSNQSRTK